MRQTFTPLLIAGLLAGASPQALLAQVPPQRPGLNIYNTAPTVANSGASNQNAPFSAPNQAQGQPTTNLVQHQYATTGQPVPTAQPQQQNQDGFFYVEDGASGPSDLASGLSDYNSSTMSQTGNQLQGNYGDLQRSSLPSGQSQTAWTNPFNHMSQGQSAPGSVRYQWTSDLVMPVRLRAGVVTNVILPDWENAKDAVLGDPNAAEAKILAPNVIALKTLRVGTDTSLSIIGSSGNVYSFYLRNEGRNSSVITDFQVFVQAEPSRSSGDWFNTEHTSGSGDTSNPQKVSGDGNITLKNAASQGDEPVPKDRRIFNMKMYEVHKGDKIIAPQYVYTDGRFTYMHFPAGMTDRPDIRRIVDGVEGRVNTHTTGRFNNTVVVEALGNFILRSGTRAVCVVQVDGRDMTQNN